MKNVKRTQTEIINSIRRVAPAQKNHLIFTPAKGGGYRRHDKFRRNDWGD